MDLAELGYVDLDLIETWLRWAGLATVFAIIAAVTVRIRLHRSHVAAQVRRNGRIDEGIVRATNSARWRRLCWTVAPPADLMRVDGLVLDRTGDRSHSLWVGPTGRGKSQSVATVRCDGKRPWLAVMPDLSMPLRARADFIWTAGESARPIDFLKGTSDDVAHFLTEVFRSGGEGVWKRAAYMATKQIVEDLDKSKTPRSLLLIGQQLREECDNDPALRRMCEGWVTRFLGAAEAMGDSVGPRGIDIAELLNQGLGVVIDNNAWRRPGLKGDVVAFGLAEAKRVADLVPGGFRLIFEEADQLGDRIDLADPFFTAGRLRQVAVDALVHSEHKLPDAMQTNSATRVYFRPNKPEHRKKVAEALDLSEGEVDRIPDYHAWIEHDGKIRRLVHFPKPRKLPPPAADGVTINSQVGDTGGNGQVERRIEIVQVPRWKGTGEPAEYHEWAGPKQLPAPSIKLAGLLEGAVVDGTHLRWNKVLGFNDDGSTKHVRHDKDGYGEIWIPGEGYRKVHRIAYELAYGAIPRNPDGTTMTVQHMVDCPKDCFKLEHLSLLTRATHSSVDRKRSILRKKAKGGSGGRGRETRR